MHAPIKLIRAELKGSEEASACGLVVRGGSPVIALCRQLVAAGHDPAIPLEAYRGDTLCLKVRSIREAAELEIAAHGVGFRKRPRGNEDGAPYSDLNGEPHPDNRPHSTDSYSRPQSDAESSS